MKIFGIIDLSTIDYYKKCSAVVFMSDCNMKCGYCHNYEYMKKNTHDIDPYKVYKKIDLTFADALVISGGEPTMQPNSLKEFCKIIKKEENLPIKLDTNGSNVDIVRELIENNLIDYLAIDVKCAFEKYFSITHYDGNKIRNNVRELIKLCKSNNIFIECRTTYIPDKMDENDIIEIVKTVKDCDLYTLQQFDREHSWKKEYKLLKEPTMEELIKLGGIAKKYINDVIIRSKEGIIHL